MVSKHKMVVLLKAIARFAEIAALVDYRLELCEKAVRII
jgi:hypothetical protein